MRISATTARLSGSVGIRSIGPGRDMSHGDGWSARSASVPNWSVAYTKGRHEKVVYSGLTGLGVEAFLPLVRKLHHWSDRKKEIATPLFPSYVFVRCAEEERSRTYGLKGLVHFVTSSGRVVPIPPSEIEAIREVLKRNVPFDPHPKLRPNHAVRVVAGPLRGITGRLVRRGRRSRLLLAISALGQAISVEVNAADVEPD